jgi:uncharacterized protein
MNIYLDSSALVKRYIEESSSQKVREWIDKAISIATSQITRAEMSAVLARATRMGIINFADAYKTLESFRTEWPDIVRLSVTELTIHRADSLAWEMGLRGYDAVHLATTLLWQETISEPIYLATYDQQLWQAGKEVGLLVLPEEKE